MSRSALLRHVLRQNRPSYRVARFLSSTKPYVDGETTHFGFEQIGVNEKQDRVRQVFDNVADSYDVMNDLMSGGLHRYWKDVFVQESCMASMARVIRQTSSEQELKVLDVAGGTGDIAFRFLQQAECVERSKSSGYDPIQITVCDINKEMLRVGQDRASQQFGTAIMESSHALQFEQGNAQQLQFDSNKFDLYTIAFGLRNVTNVDQALQEACRVLKPGGRFMCLEFSHVPCKVTRQIYDLYSFQVIPVLGQMVASDKDSYQYLVESIRKFPKQDELVERMKQAGFVGSTYTNLTGGIVAIHTGWKPM